MSGHELRSIASRARRVVLKVGTNVVIREDGRVAVARLYALAESVAALRAKGTEVILVSSGAVGVGAQRLALLERPAAHRLKEACAAIGQGELTALYADAFERHGVPCAQVLVTEDDLAIDERRVNLRTMLTTLLERGVVPVMNENDAVSTFGGREQMMSRAAAFTDNDGLAALIAVAAEADLLILLSDVEGLSTGDPSRDASATLISVIHDIDARVLALAGEGNRRGRGGMRAKLEAARLAMAAGIGVVIANGCSPGVVDRICRGEDVGTFFVAGAVV